MSEISLYRKYRPHNFQNLVGQDHVRTTLMNAAKKDTISHAYLFCGPRGTGKTSTARLVAKVLNCLELQDDFEPCNECNICVDINDARLIDIIEIDAASNRGIDEMRELREKINFAPTNAKTKVYIIDEVHMLTKEAFNALLKTLEEPPAHAYFILATTEVHKIPETIISRCQRFDFRRITEKTIMTRLSYIAQLEKIKVEEGAIEVIAHYVDGGMRDAIGLLEQLTNDGLLSSEHVCKVLGMTDRDSIEKLYNALLENDTQAALNEAKNIHSQGHDMHQFLKSFLEFLRDRMLETMKKNEAGQAAWFLKAIDVFQKALKDIRMTVIPQLPLEVAVISLCAGQGEAIPQKPAKVKVEKPKKVEVKVAMKEEIVETSEGDTSGLKEIPQEEPAEEEEDPEQNEIAQEAEDLTIASIKSLMPRLAEHISQPSTRRSFQSGHIEAVDGNIVTFGFTTKFHMDKVLDHDNRVLIEQAFKEIFGVDVKFKGTVKKVDLAPAVEEVQDEEIVEELAGDLSDEERANRAKQQDMANAALDIFGGELIED